MPLVPAQRFTGALKKLAGSGRVFRVSVERGFKPKNDAWNSKHHATLSATQHYLSKGKMNRMKTKTQIRFVLAVLLTAVGIGPKLAAGQTQPKTADVSGKWHFVFQTGGGDREFDATFQQDGEKISGKWGDENADVKGTFSAGKLTLEFPVNSSEAGPGTLKINGDFADSTLTGTWSFQEYDGTFKATRSKPATT